MRAHLCLALASVIVAEASILKENKRISPSLNPESNKRFFNKDYPGDSRPKVDVLHFNHPYPVVQDNEEFDADFVKDENTDNGEWKAQTEYDRLRHKLARLKKQAAEALEKKIQEEKDIEQASLEYQEDMAKERANVEKKKSEVIEPIHPVKPVAPAKPAPAVAREKKVEQPKSKPESKAPEKEEESASAWSWSWPWSWPKVPETPQMPKAPKMPKAPEWPNPSPAPVDTASAAKAVENAMEDFQECQKELAEAKAELKKLMDELEQAKIKQVEAHERVNQAIHKQLEAEGEENKLHSKYTEEASEHAAAEAAYMKQKAKVEKLRADLQVAAAKIKAMRDAEDKEGGVYPTPKSFASSISTSQIVIFIIGVAAGGQAA